jgi:hypothetical protein
LDIYDDDILEFWKTLSQFEVEFIMVGGFATNIHGYNRSTQDIDVWINDTPKNRKKIARALDSLSIAPAEIVERMQFIPGWTNFSLHNGFPLDIMTSLKGLENYSFEECIQIAIKPENHLLEAKRAANRPKDQLDIIELEKVRQRLEQKGGS